MLLHSMALIKIDSILFLLSLVIAFVPLSAVYSEISLPIRLIFVSMVLLSILLYMKKALLPNWILNILTIMLLIYPILSFSPDDFLIPSIEAITIVLSIRLLGRKTSREYFQIYLIAVLLLAGSSLINMGWMFLLRTFLMLILTIISILILTYIKETNAQFIKIHELLNFAKIALLMTLLSIPLSVLFFFTLPRTASPLLDIGIGKAKTGFTSTVNLGGISSIEEDTSVVMRVKIKKLPESQLYWRVITFDTFDGKTWKKTLTENAKSNAKGERITYTVYLEPLTEQYLPVLDYPFNVFMQKVIYESPASFKTNFAIEKTTKYSAISLLNASVEELNPSPLYLSLPEKFSPKIKELTESITGNATDKIEIIQRIMKFLSNYQYSLKNLPSGSQPLEDFLFNKKSGNCEYFATSMALMLRIKGIPARVVGGFKGGSYNEFGDYYIVRAREAHLWVEAWIDGKWIRLDPSGRVSRPSEPVIFHLIDYLWNKIVLDYDITAQIKLAKSIKSPKIEFNKKWLILPITIFSIILIIKGIEYMRRKRDPLFVFLGIMKKYGYERKPNQGLREFIETVDNQTLRKRAEKFITAYEEIYFKDEKITKEKLKLLQKLLREIDETHKG
ncbi:DUF3488 and transglutaminase-like domain-containing protein [Thermodesulfovibrio hydrogeniphilus]